MADEFETFRDHFLSVYQSAVADVARQIDAKAASTTLSDRSRRAPQRSAISTLPVFAAEIARRESADRQGAPPHHSAPQARLMTPGDHARFCAELAFRFMKANTFGDAEARARVEADFKASTCDPAWLDTFRAYSSFLDTDGRRRRIPYIRPADVGPRVIPMKAEARVALLGDWGTGAQPAYDILKQVAALGPDILIHLGDIYYSGTPVECQTNFLDVIDSVLRVDRADLPVFTLAGNHDMYCGGVGFYELISRLNHSPFEQPASYFCLRSEDERWQFLAMDTGLHDDAPGDMGSAVTFIEEEELAWHCERLKEFSGQTILLSHHPLLSAFSPIGDKNSDGRRSPLNPLLLKAFRSMADCGRIAAWFWGHEHTLSIYKSFAGLARGRCLGHGAVPVSILDTIYTPLPGLDQVPEIIAGTQLGTAGSVYAHGFALLSLKDGCRADYFQDAPAKPRLIYSEEIEAV